MKSFTLIFLLELLLIHLFILKVKEEDNSKFLDLVEKYFSQKVDDLMKDVHPELNYSVGATPEFTEIPRDHTAVIEKLKGKNAAHKPIGSAFYFILPPVLLYHLLSR